VRLSPDGRFLFVGNGNSAQITVFSVGGDGQLSEVIGSPFADGNPLGTPAQMALSKSGKFLFMADYPYNVGRRGPPAVDVLGVKTDGTVVPKRGSPLVLLRGAAPLSVVAYPPAVCNAN
jgi:6-phosphogluconolactonase (cycloisomerase 2 family)